MNALIEEAARHWRFVSPLLNKPATEADYDRLASLLDGVLSMTRGEPEHDLAGLASAMGDLLAAYDEEHRPMPAVSGREILRCLMQEHEIGPEGLPEVGPEAAVVEILSGRTRISALQARDLGIRFALPSHVFLSS